MLEQSYPDRAPIVTKYETSAAEGRSMRLDEEPGRPLLSDRVRSLQLPPEAQAGRSGRPLVWLLWGLLAINTLVLDYLAFQGRAGSQPVPATSTDPVPSSKSVSHVGMAADGPVLLESKGYIIPAQQILVSPKVSGMIVRLPIREGMVVKKGDELAQLEDTDYQADVARAKASLALAKQGLLELINGYRPEEKAQAKAELGEAEAQLVQAEAEWKRTSELRTRNVLSQQEYETAESRYRAMSRRVERLRNAWTLMEQGPREERIEMAKAQVAQAQAELEKAQWRLNNCTILAPISGTILKKNAEEGNIVNPIAFNGSYSLCEMADLANLEVELLIQERDISQVHVGQKCEVRAEAFPDKEPYSGVVSRLMPIADRAKGAIPVRVKIAVPEKEQGRYLKPEMGAIVRFLNTDAAGAAQTADAKR